MEVARARLYLQGKRQELPVWKRTQYPVGIDDIEIFKP
jgi:hypothetical protein